MTLSMPRTRSASSSLSPTPSALKATAMFLKRRRDWSDADADLLHQDQAMAPPRRRQCVPHPLPPSPHHHQRRPSATSSWSSLSKPTDRSAEDDEEEEESTSPFREIQASVDLVGAQIAQAQRDVAELRALLRQAIHNHNDTSARRKEAPSGMARVRIDQLCS